MNSIKENQGAVERLQQRVAEVHSWMEENKKGIEANANFIAENSKVVSQNRNWIEAQIHDIAANTGAAELLSKRAEAIEQQAAHDHALILNLFGMIDQYSK